MKLYGYFRSSTSYRLRLALQLKGLEYENCPVNLVEGQQKGEAFAGRNPFATVPMLEVDGKDRVQSMAIIEWLPAEGKGKLAVGPAASKRLAQEDMRAAMETLGLRTLTSRQLTHHRYIIVARK